MIFLFFKHHFFLEITIKIQEIPFNKKGLKNIIQKNLLFDLRGIGY
jgi:hypothetical protein